MSSIIWSFFFINYLKKICIKIVSVINTIESIKMYSSINMWTTINDILQSTFYQPINIIITSINTFFVCYFFSQNILIIIIVILLDFYFYINNINRISFNTLKLIKLTINYILIYIIFKKKKGILEIIQGNYIILLNIYIVNYEYVRYSYIFWKFGYYKMYCYRHGSIQNVTYMATISKVHVCFIIPKFYIDVYLLTNILI